MCRPSILLLSVLLVVAGLAQAYDQHAQVGCADSGETSLADPGTPKQQSVPDLHAAGCCFGSMVLALPAASIALAASANSLPMDERTARPANWHTDSPERPPRR
ncbi:MAG: hypothetical protein WD793_08000 [Steroidobacteraceae bacterium]